MAKTDKPSRPISVPKRPNHAQRLADADKNKTALKNPSPPINDEVDYEQIQAEQNKLYDRPVATNLQSNQIVNKEIEQLKKANEDLAAQLEEIKNAVLLPRLVDRYQDRVFMLDSNFYVVLDIKDQHTFKARMISPDQYSYINLNNKDISTLNYIDLKNTDETAPLKGILARLEKNIAAFVARLK